MYFFSERGPSVLPGSVSFSKLTTTTNKSKGELYLVSFVWILKKLERRFPYFPLNPNKTKISHNQHSIVIIIIILL